MLENLKAQLTQLEVKVEEKLRSWHPCQIDSHQRGRHTRDQAYKQKHFAHKYTKTPHDHHRASEDIPSPSQVHQCDSVSNNGVDVIAINSVSNYSVCASTFRNQVSFLVDAGASLSFIRGDIWDCIKPSDHPKLTPMSTRLVGANGSPLQTQGSTVVELTISG